MAGHDEEAMSPGEYLAQVQAQQEQSRMASEDFSNRWNALVLGMPLDDLETLRQALNSISDAGGPELVHGAANYMEGIVRGALMARLALASAADPNRHGFIPDDRDLDNPYCTARDNSDQVCGLPPAHGRHQ